MDGKYIPYTVAYHMKRSITERSITLLNHFLPLITLFQLTLICPYLCSKRFFFNFQNVLMMDFKFSDLVNHNSERRRGRGGGAHEMQAGQLEDIWPSNHSIFKNLAYVIVFIYLIILLFVKQK